MLVLQMNRHKNKRTKPYVLVCLCHNKLLKIKKPAESDIAHAAGFASCNLGIIVISIIYHPIRSGESLRVGHKLQKDRSIGQDQDTYMMY